MVQHQNQRLNKNVLANGMEGGDSSRNGPRLETGPAITEYIVK